uniref:Uncharacterized protein n=1 Tax=Alexandrium catenella TaxID=2925 RepID=A0A7S1Q8T3_ALECA
MAQAVLAQVISAPAAPSSPPSLRPLRFGTHLTSAMDFSSIPGVTERYVTANKGRVPVLFAKRDASGEWNLGGPAAPAEGGSAQSLAKRTAEMMKRDLIGADATLSGRVKPDLLDAMQEKGKRVIYMGR